MDWAGSLRGGREPPKSRMHETAVPFARPVRLPLGGGGARRATFPRRAQPVTFAGGRATFPPPAATTIPALGAAKAAPLPPAVAAVQTTTSLPVPLAPPSAWPSSFKPAAALLAFLSRSRSSEGGEAGQAVAWLPAAQPPTLFPVPGAKGVAPTTTPARTAGTVTPPIDKCADVGQLEEEEDGGGEEGAGVSGGGAPPAAPAVVSVPPAHTPFFNPFRGGRAVERTPPAPAQPASPPEHMQQPPSTLPPSSAPSRAPPAATADAVEFAGLPAGNALPGGVMYDVVDEESSASVPAQVTLRCEALGIGPNDLRVLTVSRHGQGRVAGGDGAAFAQGLQLAEEVRTLRRELVALSVASSRAASSPQVGDGSGPRGRFFVVAERTAHLAGSLLGLAASAGDEGDSATAAVCAGLYSQLQADSAGLSVAVERERTRQAAALAARLAGRGVEPVAGAPVPLPDRSAEATESTSRARGRRHRSTSPALASPERGHHQHSRHSSVGRHVAAPVDRSVLPRGRPAPFAHSSTTSSECIGQLSEGEEEAARGQSYPLPPSKAAGHAPSAGRSAVHCASDACAANAWQQLAKAGADAAALTSHVTRAPPLVPPGADASSTWAATVAKRLGGVESALERLHAAWEADAAAMEARSPLPPLPRGSVSLALTAEAAAVSRVAEEARCIDYAPDSSTHPIDMAYIPRVVRSARKIRLSICVTCYNEQGEELRRTLEAIALNLPSLAVMAGLHWSEVHVLIVCDGRSSMAPSMLDFLDRGGLHMYEQKLVDAAMGTAPWPSFVGAEGVPEGLTVPVPSGPTLAGGAARPRLHIFERTVSLDRARAWDVQYSPLQLSLVVKEANAGKLHSHLVFFAGFATRLNPKMVLLLDCGTAPEATAISRLCSALDGDPNIGGACGQLRVQNLRFWEPVEAAQAFEYAASHACDKTLESITGLIGCLPGAFSAFRWIAIRGEPLVSYFKLEEAAVAVVSPFTANMFLAEDRVLCHELLAKRGRGWGLRYYAEAVAETDVPTSILALLKQRRRWINGTWFAQLRALGAFPRLFTDAKHSLAAQAGLLLQLPLLLLQTAASWFGVALLYLSFLVVFQRVAAVSPVGVEVTAALLLLFKSSFCFLLFLQLLVAFGAGSGPLLASTSSFYFTLAIVYAVMTTLGMACGLWLIATGGVSIWVALGLCASLGDLLVSGILHGTIGTIMLTGPQYVLLSGLFLTAFPIFSLANVHDVSWGSRPSHSGPDEQARLATTSLALAHFRLRIVASWAACNAFTVFWVTHFDPELSFFALVVVGLSVFASTFRLLGALAYAARRATLAVMRLVAPCCWRRVMVEDHTSPAARDEAMAAAWRGQRAVGLRRRGSAVQLRSLALSVFHSRAPTLAAQSGLGARAQRVPGGSGTAGPAGAEESGQAMRSGRSRMEWACCSRGAFKGDEAWERENAYSHEYPLPPRPAGGEGASWTGAPVAGFDPDGVKLIPRPRRREA